MNPLPTKLFMSWEDIQTDHLDVPAFFHRDGKGLSQVPQYYHFSSLHGRRNLNNCFWGLLYMFADSSPIWVVTTSPISSPTTTILVFYTFVYSILSDVDSWHGDHSGELPLFVGGNVCLCVSYLICVFQDSVPAGSYNDPFLSSVISMVAPTRCHGPN